MITAGPQLWLSLENFWKQWGTRDNSDYQVHAALARARSRAGGLHFVLERRWHNLGQTLDPEDFTDARPSQPSRGSPRLNGS